MKKLKKIYLIFKNSTTLLRNLFVSVFNIIAGLTILNLYFSESKFTGFLGFLFLLAGLVFMVISIFFLLKFILILKSGRVMEILYYDEKAEKNKEQRLESKEQEKIVYTKEDLFKKKSKSKTAIKPKVKKDDTILGELDEAQKAIKAIKERRGKDKEYKASDPDRFKPKALKEEQKETE